MQHISKKSFKKSIACAMAAVVMLCSHSVMAKSTMEPNNQVPGFFRFNLGSMQITALYDGMVTLPASLFKGVSTTEVERNWMNTHDHTPKGIEDSVNAYLINTGKQLIMVDAGGAKCFPAMGELVNNLQQAGYKPSDVDAILITHFHPDHGCGLSDEKGNAVFNNATVFVEKNEAAYWLSLEQTAKAPENFQGFFLMIQKAIAPYQNNHRLKTFNAGEKLFDGVTSIAAYGHTPGHTVYQIESQNQTAIFWGDLVHSHRMQLDNPKISIEFDTDPAQAIRTRELILAQAAKNNWLIGGAHIPFPGLGYVHAVGSGYDWSSVKYQNILK